MTFKHTNFEDSVTMRSLEKLARDKGWVKEQPMTKSAASELDLSPSDSLTDNVLKLCAGLRQAGFDKYAVELEGKFLVYKKAQTLYDVSGEEGEDLVHAAHPKGSHKLENVDSDEAVFEDIIDKHLKHVQMVEKQPTGKLANAASVITAVKKVLGQNIGPETYKTPTKLDDPKALLNVAYQNALKAYNISAKAGGLYDITVSWLAARLQVIKSVADKSIAQLTTNDIDDAANALQAMSRNLKPDFAHNVLPNFATKGISDDAVWEQVKTFLDAAQSKLDAAKVALTAIAVKASALNTIKVVHAQIHDPKAQEEGKKAVALALATIKKGLQQFLSVFYGKSLEYIKPDLDKNMKWIDDTTTKISQLPPDQDVPKQFMTELGENISDFSRWVKEQRDWFGGTSQLEGAPTTKVDDEDWWKRFNYAASLVAQGVSTWWGAMKAINNDDVSGLQFHAAHISADQVAATINNNLVRPLQAFKQQLSGLNMAAKTKLPQDQQAFIDAIGPDLDQAISVASSAVSKVTAQADPNMRLIHPSKIGPLFGPPLDKIGDKPLFAATVQSLDDLKAKCQAAVAAYNSVVTWVSSKLGKGAA